MFTHTRSLTPNPSPNGEGLDYRDTPCGSQIFPLIITQANCFLHSPSLQERGQGGEAKGVKCVIPIVVHRYLHLSLLKRTVSSTPPLYRRGGWGVRLFFICKREDVKSSFTSSLFTYILFLVPLLTTPHYMHIHKNILVSAPSCVRKSWEESVG